MIPATSPPPTAPPDDPVVRTLSDPTVRQGLLGHALAILDQWLADRPRGVRLQEAEEIVQNTCVVVLTRQADYDPAVGTVVGWAHGILVRVAYSLARTVRRQAAQPADPAHWERLAADLCAPPADAADASLDAPVYLARLTSDQRAILDMRYRVGLELDQIAVRLGISPGAVRVRICRALAAARDAAGSTPTEDRP
jgi:RNA polymerase sigma-70 factor (ECF subfamily)